MPKSYAIYETIIFGEYEEPVQQQLSLGGDMIKMTPTKIAKTNNSFGKFDIFRCNFDLKKFADNIYIWMNDDYESINYYFQKSRFDCLYLDTKKLALFECSYKISDKMLKEINAFDKDNKRIYLRKKEFDFNKIEKVSKLVRAWFRVQESNLSAIGMTGHDIKNTSSFTDYKKTGNLSSLTILITIESITYSIGLSNHSFTIWKNVSKDIELQIIDQILKLLEI